MKQCLFIAILGSLLLCTSGCSTFRKYFNEDPSIKKERRELSSLQRQSSPVPDNDNRPIPEWFDFKKKQSKKPLLLDNRFSDTERAAVERVQNQTDLWGDSTRENHRLNQRQQDRNSEYVFGSGPGDWLNLK